MGKVPVGRAISAAYRFLFARLGTVLGLGWLPAAFYAAAVWFCLQRLGAAVQVAVPSSGAFNEFTAVDFLALLVATVILVPTALVPFAARALGRPQEPAVAHFVYGKREFRLTLALLTFYVLLIAVLVALAITLQLAIGIGVPKPGAPLAGYTMPAEWQGIPLAVWLNGAAGLVIGFMGLFLAVRFGFFLTALSVAEEHVTLNRAWSLSRGSFWRLAIVSLAIGAPMAALFAGAVWLIEGDSLPDVLRTAWSGIPSEGMSGLYRLQFEHAGALAGVLAVLMVMKSALVCGASAYAYRTVALGEMEQEAPREAPAAPAPRHVEPEFEPAWAAAKAMADAHPRWRPREPVVEPEAPASAPDEHALASEAAATVLADMPIAHVAAHDTAPEGDAMSHAAADRGDVQAGGHVAAEPAANAMTQAEIVHAAFAQMPGYVGGAQAPDAHAAASGAAPGPESESHAPPLDPAGAAAMTAARELEPGAPDSGR
ncbi:MAG TPA: hypothetical protein VMH86_03575 [Rhizomicrobium sp.]|nr:hypothetical protein [Rhizomicrobium sp.]